MSKKIYVGKLPNKITDQDLRDLFSKIGNVISVKMVKTNSFQKNTGYAYVQMDSDENTTKAIKTLNNSVLEGSNIKVMEAHSLDQEKPFEHYWKKRKY